MSTPKIPIAYHKEFPCKVGQWVVGPVSEGRITTIFLLKNTPWITISWKNGIETSCPWCDLKTVYITKQPIELNWN